MVEGCAKKKKEGSDFLSTMPTAKSQGLRLLKRAISAATVSNADTLDPLASSMAIVISKSPMSKKNMAELFHSAVFGGSAAAVPDTAGGGVGATNEADRRSSFVK